MTSGSLFRGRWGVIALVAFSVDMLLQLTHWSDPGVLTTVLVWCGSFLVGATVTMVLNQRGTRAREAELLVLSKLAERTSNAVIKGPWSEAETVAA